MNTESGLKIFSESNGYTLDLTPNIKSDWGGHKANIQHFVEVVLNGAEPMFLPEQGINVVKIIEAIYKSAKEGKEIVL